MVEKVALSGKYQAYPEYKDSGVEWLGEIPVNWELWKLSHAYNEIGSGTTPPSSSDEWYGGSIPWVTTGELREMLMLEKVSTAISLIQERRTALISAAVTGKIHLRNWQVPATTHSKKEHTHDG